MEAERFWKTNAFLLGSPLSACVIVEGRVNIFGSGLFGGRNPDETILLAQAMLLLGHDLFRGNDDPFFRNHLFGRVTLFNP